MSNYQGLVDEQTRFSVGAQISAAGMMILTKEEMSRPSFGAEGLKLSYAQLDRQREIAQQMRVFTSTWMNALDGARQRAAEAIWNLDASAMQELHLVSYNDNDQYDEFLNALMVREYLWHVEADPAVEKAIKGLDDTFQAQLVPDGKTTSIKQRFIAPFVRPKHGRELVAHFTWAGMPLPKKLSDVPTTTAIRNFKTLVHGVAADVVCNQLSVGVADGSCLAKLLHLSVKTIEPKSRKGMLAADKLKDKTKVHLMCISTPDEES